MCGEVAGKRLGCQNPRLSASESRVRTGWAVPAPRGIVGLHTRDRSLLGAGSRGARRRMEARHPSEMICPQDSAMLLDIQGARPRDIQVVGCSIEAGEPR